MTLMWGIIVAVAISLELFSFQLIQHVLQPLWNILGMVAGWIVYLLDLLLSGLSSLLGPLHSPPAQVPMQKTTRPPLATPPPSSGISPEVFLIVRLVLLVIVFLILALVIRMILKTWQRTHTDENEDEIREGLSVRAILRARRQARGQRKTALSELEALDPSSVRARYREFLQVMAQYENDLRRWPSETPVEYQARLHSTIEKMSEQGLQADEPSDAAFLRELTQAYIQERYRGKPTGQREHAYLSKWFPVFIGRLTASKSTDISKCEKI